MKHLCALILVAAAVGCASPVRQAINSAEHVGGVATLVQSAKETLVKAKTGTSPASAARIDDAIADLTQVSDVFVPLLKKDAEQQGKLALELQKEQDHYVGYKARILGWKLGIAAGILVLIIVVAGALSQNLVGPGGTIAKGVFHVATGGLVILYKSTVKMVQWLGGKVKGVFTKTPVAPVVPVVNSPLG